MLTTIRTRPARAGFTIVEMLVATVVFLIIVGVVMGLVNQTSRIWRDSNSRIQAFQEARAGYDSMTRMLAQATLNTYLDYYDAALQPRSSLTTPAALAAFVPATYDRLSDLHFVSGHANTLLGGSPTAITTQTQAIFFQAPRGYSVTYQRLDNALNATGYFLQFDDGGAAVPDFIKTAPSYKPRYRFRLMEMVQGTEDFSVYFDPAQGTAPGPNDWFVQRAAANSRVIAENVIALVLLPRLPERQDDPALTGKGVSLAPNYTYNSRVKLGAITDTTWPGANPAFPGDAFTAYPTTGTPMAVTRHHQLPPVVKVLMVVIDEASAIRLQGTAQTVPAAIDFRATNLFTDAAQLANDVQAVEDICNAKTGNLTGNKIPLNYRVFTIDIVLRQAKWSNK